MPEADAFLGIGEIENIDQAVEQALAGKRFLDNQRAYCYPEQEKRVLTTPGHYAYVKIAEGCSNRCAYCAIPYIRGPLLSRPMENIEQEVRRLCAAADVITPNLTEACFLTGVPMPQGPMDPSQARRLLEDLLRLGCRAAVVTSAHLQGREGRLATLVQGEDGEAVALCTQQLHAHFPGTGDLFASVLVGALLKGKDLQEAAAEASAFVARSIAYTLERGTPVREGVLLEELLGELAGGLSGAGMERLPL